MVGGSSTRSSSLLDAVASVRAGQMSATDMIGAAQQTVAELDPQIRAWVEMSPDAHDTARSWDLSGQEAPLRGLAFGVKDIIDAAGLPSRCGSPVTTSPTPVGTSAACVRRLESLGAVVLGKTATTEYGFFAPAPTHNPAAPGHTPGGSSSGSAAAVAAGMVPLAVGTQTAGSTTRPASYCGVVGMVLAHGSVDMSGITGLSHSFDSLGLLTRTVDDIAHVHRLLTGARSDMAYTGATRIHLWRADDLDLALDPTMTALLDRSASMLADDGMAVDDLDWSDHIFTLLRDHPVVMAYEAARERSSLLNRLDDLSTPLAELLSTGAQTPDEAYRAALVRCSTSRTRLEQFLEDRDGVIIGPAAPGPPPPGLEATGSPDMSRPWQAMGLPVVTVPGARTTGGLPLGIQVIGVPGRETQVLEVARTLERLMSAVTVQSADGTDER